MAQDLQNAGNSGQFAQEATDWRKRYEELLAQWKTLRGEDRKSVQAFRLITENRLDEAAKIEEATKGKAPLVK